MTHLQKLGLAALVSLVLFSPGITHAQSHEWDSDRVDDLILELHDFRNTFEPEDVDQEIATLIEFLNDFEIEEEAALYIEPISTAASVTTPGGVSSSYATYTVKFDVTANDADIYIPRDAGDKGGSPAVDYRFYGDEEKMYEGGMVITNGVLTSTADSRGTDFLVREGDSERFTLTVTLDPSVPVSIGLALEGIYYSDGRDEYKLQGIRDVEDFTTKKVSIPESASLDTYKGYLDGRLFITTKNITEASALENCKLNDSTNPTKAIRCTWGGKEIHRRDLAPTGTITAKSVYYEGASNTISGTARNTPTVGISIDNGDKVYGSGRITVRNGSWSVKVPSLSAGTYTVSLYEEKDRIIASTRIRVEEVPQVLPSTTNTKTVPQETADEPLVLPAESTGGKTSSQTSLSASAAYAFEEFLAAFKEYLRTQ